MEAATQSVWQAQVVGKQEESSLELLNSHHGLCKVLQVHVSHFGGLSASDAIMMLHLRSQVIATLIFSLLLSTVGNRTARILRCFATLPLTQPSGGPSVYPEPIL